MAQLSSCLPMGLQGLRVTQFLNHKLYQLFHENRVGIRSQTTIGGAHKDRCDEKGWREPFLVGCCAIFNQ